MRNFVVFGTLPPVTCTQRSGFLSHKLPLWNFSNLMGCHCDMITAWPAPEVACTHALRQTNENWTGITLAIQSNIPVSTMGRTILEPSHLMRSFGLFVEALRKISSGLVTLLNRTKIVANGDLSCTNGLQHCCAERQNAMQNTTEVHVLLPGGWKAKDCFNFFFIHFLVTHKKQVSFLLNILFVCHHVQWGCNSLTLVVQMGAKRGKGGIFKRKIQHFLSMSCFCRLPNGCWRTEHCKKRGKWPAFCFGWHVSCITALLHKAQQTTDLQQESVLRQLTRLIAGSIASQLLGLHNCSKCCCHWVQLIQTCCCVQNQCWNCAVNGLKS